MLWIQLKYFKKLSLRVHAVMFTGTCTVRSPAWSKVQPKRFQKYHLHYSIFFEKWITKQHTSFWNFFSSNLNCLHPIRSLSLTPPKKRVSKKYNWQTHEQCGILLLQYYSILIVIWKSCLKRFVILHKVNGLYMYIQNKWFLVIYNSDLHVNLNFTTADLPYTLVPGLNAMHDDEIQNTVTVYI